MTTENAVQPRDDEPFVDETGTPLPWAPAMVDELAQLSPQQFMQKMGEALRWYVENDETNIGQAGNEFWELGLYKGRALVEAYDKRMAAQAASSN